MSEGKTHQWYTYTIRLVKGLHLVLAFLFIYQCFQRTNPSSVLISTNILLIALAAMALYNRFFWLRNALIALTFISHQFDVLPLNGRLLFSIFALQFLTYPRVVWFKTNLKIPQRYMFISVFFLVGAFFTRIIPGMYFPPFYQGIAGWELEVGSDLVPKEFTIYSLRMSDGEKFSDPVPLFFLTPINFYDRFISQISRKNHLDEGMAFFFQVYSYKYESLKKGNFFGKYFLNSYGYPRHMHSESFQKIPGDFIEPNKVKEAHLFYETYDINGKLLRTSKIFAINVRTNERI